MSNSTGLYFGLALGWLALDPVISREGHAVGAAVGGPLAELGTLLAGILRAKARR